MIPLFSSPSICILVTAFHNTLKSAQCNLEIRVCIEIIFLKGLSECKRLMSLLCSELPKLNKELAIPSATDSNKNENILYKKNTCGVRLSGVSIKRGE